MKKGFVFISGVLLANVCAFADRWAFSEFTKLFPYSEIEYKVIEDADVYNQRTEPIDKVGKGETFTTDRIALVYFDKKDNNRPRNGAIVYGCKNGWILSKDVVVNDSDVFEQDFVTKSDLDMEDDYSWIPVWWNNVVVSKEPRKLMETYSKWLQGCPLAGAPHYATVRPCNNCKDIKDIKLCNVSTKENTGEFTMSDAFGVAKIKNCHFYVNKNQVFREDYNFSGTKSDSIVTLESKHGVE